MLGQADTHAIGQRRRGGHDDIVEFFLSEIGLNAQARPRPFDRIDPAICDAADVLAF